MKDFLNIVFGLFVALLDRYSEHSQESERWRQTATGQIETRASCSQPYGIWLLSHPTELNQHPNLK